MERINVWLLFCTNKTKQKKKKMGENLAAKTLRHVCDCRNRQHLAADARRSALPHWTTSVEGAQRGIMFDICDLRLGKAATQWW